MVLVPVLVVVLVRLNKAYEAEKAELEHEAREAVTAPILRYHTVIVLIEKLDQSSARAIQYARTLTPDELQGGAHRHRRRRRPPMLAEEWTRLGLARVPLEVVECPDRRITRCAARGGGRGRVRRQHRGQRADPPPRVHAGSGTASCTTAPPTSIAKALADVPHANVTFVPYHLGTRSEPVLEAPAPPLRP